MAKKGKGASSHAKRPAPKTYKAGGAKVNVGVKGKGYLKRYQGNGGR